ncbi:MAG TPA: CBS domain-containing protein [Thermoplasmata archaeon]|nr:CBS domain-containing protein [Thermoplasmata archaeon]
MKVRDVMSKDPITLKPTASLREAAITLADESVGGCPVVDDSGKMIGMLSEVDILEALKTQNKELRMLMPPEITFGISFVEVIKEREALAAFKEVENRLVRDVMTKEVHAVSPEDALERPIRLMVQHKIHRIPVVERDRLVGIVTRGDVLRGFFRHMGKTTYQGAL